MRKPKLQHFTPAQESMMETAQLHEMRARILEKGVCAALTPAVDYFGPELLIAEACAEALKSAAALRREAKDLYRRGSSVKAEPITGRRRK